MIVVIGNGKSRENLNLDKIHERAYTFGCNALYRDFAPDYLYTGDPPITHEVLSSDYILNHKVYLNNLSLLPGTLRLALLFEGQNIIENDVTDFEFIVNGYRDTTYLTWVPEDHKINFTPWHDDGVGLSAGLMSIRLAHHLIPNDDIYLIGFDVFGNRNNIYDGTNSYPKIGSSNHMEQEFIEGFAYLLEEYPNINIKRVIDQDQQIDGIPNVSEEELWHKLETSQKI